MDLDTFFAQFKVTHDIGNCELPTKLDVDGDFISCINALGGKTFNDGLYRVFRADQVVWSTKMMEAIVPALKNKIKVFGYDWLGRCFATDSDRVKDGHNQILLIEPGAGEAMEIPSDITGFHNEILIEYTNSALADKFYHEWRKFESNQGGIEPDQCVGYRIPLFMRGSDTVDNLELSDLEVYLDICGQLRAQTINLKEGQVIGEVRITESD